MKNTTQQPLNGNGLVQLITVENSIRHKWVKVTTHVHTFVHVNLHIAHSFLKKIYYYRFNRQLSAYMRGWTGEYPTPTSLPLSPHFPPPFTPLPSPSPPTSLPHQPHFPPLVRFFPPPDKILFLFMNLSVAKNQN